MCRFSVNCLAVAQREFGRFIVEGEGTAEEAMNNIAEEHDQILRDAGLIDRITLWFER